MRRLLSCLLAIAVAVMVLPQVAISSSRLALSVLGSYDGSSSAGIVAAAVSPSQVDESLDAPDEDLITFSASCADSAPCGADAVADWDFGDGSRVRNASLEVQHRYETPGRYIARASVRSSAGAGASSITVLISPRYADVDTTTSAVRDDRAAIWSVAALGMFDSCGPALPATDPDLDPSSSRVNRSNFCPEPVASPLMVVSPAMPAGTDKNGITGVSCTSSAEACGLPVEAFASNGNPERSCDATCQETLVSEGFLSANGRLVYDPTNCADGWVARRSGVVNSTWTVVAGLENGCMTRAQFFVALARGLDGSSEFGPLATAASTCSDLDSSEGASAARRLKALGLNVARTRSGQSVCDLGASLLKKDAYRLVGASSSLPSASCTTTLRDLADVTLGHGSASQISGCGEIAAIVEAAAPIVGDTYCADGAGRCFNGREAMSRADAAILLASQLVGLPYSASGIKVGLASDVNPVQVGDATTVRLTATFPASYAANDQVTITWPNAQSGLSTRSCSRSSQVTIGSDLEITATCNYSRLVAGSTTLRVLITDEDGRQAAGVMSLVASDTAPQVTLPAAATNNEGSNATISIDVTNPSGSALTATVRSFGPYELDPGVYPATGTRANTGWSSSTNVATGTLTVSSVSNNELVLRLDADDDAYGAWTAAVRLCSSALCTIFNVSGTTAAVNDAPDADALVTIPGGLESTVAITLGGDDSHDAGRDGYPVEGSIALYELTTLPSDGVLQIDADPTAGTSWVNATTGITTNNAEVKYTFPSPGANTPPSTRSFSYRVRDAGYPTPAKWSTAGMVVLLVDDQLTEMLAPAQVQGLVATAGGGYVDLSWTAVSATATAPVSGYHVYRVLAAGGYELVGTTTATTYAVSDLNAGTEYVFVVAAYNAAGDGPKSLSASATPTTLAPGRVTGLDYEYGAITIDLSWNAQSATATVPINGYHVYKLNPITLSYDEIGTTESNSFSVGEVLLGSEYSFKVAAYNENGVGLFSTALVVSTAPAVPNRVKTLSAQNVANSPTNVDLSWGAVAPTMFNTVTGYKVYEKEGSGAWTLVGTVSSATTTLRLYSRYAERSFTYKVLAYNEIGSGTASPLVTLLVLGAAPGGTPSMAATPGAGYVDLSWGEVQASSSAAVDGYRVYEVTDSVWTLLSELSTSARSYRVENLTSETTHSYGVVAYNLTGNGTVNPVMVTVTADAPPQVTNLAGTAGVGYIDLSWSAVNGSRTAPVNGYHVYQLNTVTNQYAQIAEVTSGTTFRVSGMYSQTAYTFKVAAYNTAGDGSRSSAVTVTVTAEPPAAPTGLTASLASTTSVLVNWNPVSATRTAPVDGYHLYRQSGASWTLAATTNSSTTSATVTGLTLNNSYTFRVAAYNTAGDGTASSTYTITISLSVPSAVSSLTATAGLGYVDLSWPAVTYPNNITAPDGYHVYVVNGAQSDLVGTVAAGTTSFRVSNLNSEQPYTFKVAAYNNAGDGTLSPAATATPTGTVPGAVSGLSVSATVNTVTLTWDPVTATRTAPVNGYHVYRQDGASWTLLGSTTNATTYQTPSGSAELSYTYKVAAYNAAGDGTAASSSVTVPADTPGTVASLTGVAGVGYVDLSWSAASSSSGAPVNGYHVYAVAGATQTLFATVSSGTTSYRADNLNAESSYTFKVVAYNTAGDGTGSSVTKTVLAEVPAQVTGLGAAAGVGYVDLSWTALAATRTAPVNGYHVYQLNTITSLYVQVATVTSGTTHRVSGLTSETAYTFKVAAYNTAGDGSLSSASSATVIATAPAQVTGLSGTAGPNYVDLSWSAVTATATSPVNGYKVYQVSGGSDTLVATVGSATLTRRVTPLTPATYTYKVAAYNSAGNGTASTTVTVTIDATPAAVTSLTATAGVGYVDLSWSAVTNAAITGYHVFQLDGASYTQIAEVTSGTTYRVVGLTSEQSYTFKVAAYNIQGDGTASSAASATVVAAVPTSAPTLSGTVGIGSVALSWTTVSPATTQPVNGYKLYQQNGANWDLIQTTSSTSYTVTGLNAEQAYSFRVAAYNTAGVGTYSSTVSKTPTGTVPAQVTGASATAALGGFTITWGAVTATATAPVNGYYVQQYNGSSWSNLSAKLATTTYTVSGVNAELVYTLRVVANNAAGDGTPSSTVSVTTLGNVPSQVTGLSATAGVGSVALSWTAVTPTSLQPVNGYRVYQQNGGLWTALTPTTASTSYTVTGLTAEQSYTFKVVAFNLAGEGAASSTASATPTAVAPSSAPTLSGTAGVGYVDLSWTAVSPTATERVNGYHVEQYNTVSTQWVQIAELGSATTTYRVDTLYAETTYTYRVAAYNTAGNGAFSSVVAKTVLGTVPAQVTGLTATAGARQVSLAWTAVTGTRTAPVNGYDVYQLNGASWTLVGDNVATNSYTATGLVVGTSYSFRVEAYNLAGAGTVSASASATPFAAVPGAPGTPASAAYSTKVVLNWSAPSDDGGATITAYSVEYKTTAGSSWTVFSNNSNALTTTVTGLTNGTSYDFRVAAINSAGKGAYSATDTDLPPGPVYYVGSAASTSLAQSTVNLPAGATTGDIAIVFAWKNSATAPSVATGWTQLATNAGGGSVGAQSYAAGYKVLTSTDTTTGAWTNASYVSVVVVRNAFSPATWVQASTGANTNAPALPALTLTTNTSWVVGFITGNTNTYNAAAVAGMTNRSSGFSIAQIGAWTFENPSPGTTSFTSRGPSGMSKQLWSAISVEVRPL